MTYPAMPPLTPPSRRAAAWTGAKHALVAWPLITLAIMAVAFIVMSGAKRLEDTSVVLVLLFFGPLRYGLIGWPIVTALGAGVSALFPRLSAKRVAWSVSAGCVLAAPFVFSALSEVVNGAAKS
ncbi:hypothetical protein [Amycolatopsis sp. CA-230715]|uniref:hypothetical protein n=1 Tax=Amycolatopsis sp. CA-230715 TaxID=2745196 RepID=UPI001C039CC6|nr:hypothetical protein [Amycolatopsis sp. CA-230715]QWF84593.1 hypothetical protein HUW46_08044 [Amycolatopsis sp. CA-230715]